MNKCIAVVIDTNVLIKGSISHRNEYRRLLNLAYEGKIKIYGSQSTYEEFRDKVHHKRFIRFLSKQLFTAEKLISEYRNLVGMVAIPPSLLELSVCRDHDDDEWIRIALSSGSKIVITEDDDLLSLKHYQEVRFVTTERFLTTLKNLSSS